MEFEPGSLVGLILGKWQFVDIAIHSPISTNSLWAMFLRWPGHWMGSIEILLIDHVLFWSTAITLVQSFEHIVHRQFGRVV